MVWIGVYPSTFLEPLDPAVNELIDTIERRGADLASYTNVDPGSDVEPVSAAEEPPRPEEEPE